MCKCLLVFIFSLFLRIFVFRSFPFYSVRCSRPNGVCVSARRCELVFGSAHVTYGTTYYIQCGHNSFEVSLQRVKMQHKTCVRCIAFRRISRIEIPFGTISFLENDRQTNFSFFNQMESVQGIRHPLVAPRLIQSSVMCSFHFTLFNMSSIYTHAQLQMYLSSCKSNSKRKNVCAAHVRTLSHMHFVTIHTLVDAVCFDKTN